MSNATNFVAGCRLGDSRVQWRISGRTFGPDAGSFEFLHRIQDTVAHRHILLYRYNVKVRGALSGQPCCSARHSFADCDTTDSVALVGITVWLMPDHDVFAWMCMVSVRWQPCVAWRATVRRVRHLRLRCDTTVSVERVAPLGDARFLRHLFPRAL